MNEKAATSRPTFVNVWDTAVVPPEDYAGLATAPGDLVRASGRLGVERVSAGTLRVLRART